MQNTPERLHTLGMQDTDTLSSTFWEQLSPAVASVTDRNNACHHIRTAQSTDDLV